MNNDFTWAFQIQPWLVNLKKACPTAYTYPYDDVTSNFHCQEQGAVNMLGYRIAYSDLAEPTA